jgi:sugar lactone lactonase YvrE
MWTAMASLALCTLLSACDGLRPDADMHLDMSPHDLVDAPTQDAPRDVPADHPRDVRDEGGNDIADLPDAPDVIDMCIPLTCSPGQCGMLPNGDNCGTPLDCGPASTACGPGETCGGDNQCFCAGTMPMECPDGCKDLSKDAANCGACGHDCLGGACMAGKCQPKLLAQGQQNPTVLALSSTDVFWVNSAPMPNGMVQKLSKDADPSTAPTMLAPGLDLPVALTLDLSGGVSGQKIYFATFVGGEIFRANLDGSTMETMASSQDTPSAVAVDATKVYWASFAGSEILQLAISDPGGTATPIATSQTNPSALVVSGGAAYWTNKGATNMTTGRVVKRPLPTGSATPLAMNEGEPVALVVDSGQVFYADRGTGMIKVVSTTSGAPVVITMGQSTPTAIAVDADYVYWVNRAQSGQLMRAAKQANATAEVLLDGLDYPAGIALDTDLIYFTESNNAVAATSGAAGTVSRLRKPLP